VTTPSIPPPRSARDVHDLWTRGGAPSAPYPAWLDGRLRSYYRQVVVDPASARAAAAAWHALSPHGLVVEDRPDGALSVYVPEPHPTPVFSIAVLRTDALDRIEPPARPTFARDRPRGLDLQLVADPFLWPVGGRWYLFFEAFDWAANKGVIACASAGADLADWTDHGVVLEEPFHLSYPHVFAWEGRLLLVPESHQAREVRLYEAVEFPTRWRLASVLLAGRPFADATPFRWKDRWWLFADTTPDGAHDTLALFGAPALEGPWCEHPRSPVVAGTRDGARPAGRVLTDGAAPVRCAQSSVPAYGTSVSAFDVVDLTEATYAERPWRERVLGPGRHDWNAGGMHHVDAHRHGGGWIVACDGWRWGF
jgi:hypothetical protein